MSGYAWNTKRNLYRKRTTLFLIRQWQLWANHKVHTMHSRIFSFSIPPQRMNTATYLVHPTVYPFLRSEYDRDRSEELQRTQQ